ncbi:phage minor capsid protein [Nonomuraea diastatica]|uniref:Minor capsid protein n=1 Tax=Nonomuraea diastatica TaxID=1848329 RepID=A0A4R4W1Z8_9ACTN|nr:phage minor capsid protein [Nonomuraea diastatica]TDD11861.1 hypothetical protein E1294_44435 [Nonomuraea diastatica]
MVAQVAGRALTGAETREQATQRALDMFARKGITGFTDSKGRSWSMGSYTEMAVRTAMSRAAVDGHLATLKENGVDLVIVSRLPFTCPKCDFWEGKILTQSGRIGWRQELSYVSDEQVDVLVEGTVEQARTAGLLHPGCGHNLLAYLPGATKRPVVRKHPADYGDSQKMRRMERDLRAAKREASVALEKKDRDRAEQRVQTLNDRIREHAKESGLPIRRVFDEWLEMTFIGAERYTRGVMVNEEGRRRGIDGRSLLSGRQDIAHKYASDELKRWWDDHPRMTFNQFRAQLLGRDSDKKAARRTRENRR